MSSPVSEEDARALVRLLARVAELRADQETARCFLMNGFLQILPASAWSWLHVAKQSGNRPPRITRLHASKHHPGAAVFEAALRSPLPVSHPFASRDAVIPPFPDPSILDSPDRIAFALRPLSLRELSAIAVFRDPSEPAFGARERELIKLLSDEVRWLHGAGWHWPGRKTKVPLSPRRKQVLDLLVSGCTRNEIAQELGISVETASGYVKEVYAMFRVSSQAGLMAHFLMSKPAKTNTETPRDEPTRFGPPHQK